MTDEAKLRVAALRWAHLHEDCNDEDDTCPVQDECLRCTNVLCNLRTAANLIVSLSTELEKEQEMRQHADEVATLFMKENEKLKRERDAAVEDLRQLKTCKNCVGYAEFLKEDGNIDRCMECDDRSHWQWRGMKVMK